MFSVCQRYTWPMCQTVIQGELVVKFFVQWLLSKNKYDTYQNHSIPIWENNIWPTLTKFPILKEKFKLLKTCFNSGWTLILTIWLEKRITLKVPTMLYRCTLFCVYKINFKKAFNILAKDSIVINRFELFIYLYKRSDKWYVFWVQFQTSVIFIFIIKNIKKHQH